MSGMSLFVEAKRRRGELAMYVLPKGLESVWIMARGKGWVFKTGNWGEGLVRGLLSLWVSSFWFHWFFFWQLTALGMAMVMVCGSACLSG